MIVVVVVVVDVVMVDGRPIEATRIPADLHSEADAIQPREAHR